MIGALCPPYDEARAPTFRALKRPDQRFRPLARPGLVPIRTVYVRCTTRQQAPQCGNPATLRRVAPSCIPPRVGARSTGRTDALRVTSLATGRTAPDQQQSLTEQSDSHDAADAWCCSWGGLGSSSQGCRWLVRMAARAACPIVEFRSAISVGPGLALGEGGDDELLRVRGSGRDRRGGRDLPSLWRRDVLGAYACGAELSTGWSDLDDRRMSA